jgi:RNA polymerase sigma factor (sigma-70 family)
VREDALIVRPFALLAHPKDQVTRLAEIRIADDLLARARRGEEAAQAYLYGALAPATFGLIRRLVGTPAVAEDLFQETMMTLYERLGDFRGEAPLGVWVRQIAVSRCLMYLRSPWHRARLDLGACDENELPPALVPQVAAPLAETLDLERALASLEPTGRAVVWLFEVEGYSHEEIARAFGRSVSFSKSQLARAHRRLRAWFDAQPLRAGQSCTPA